MSLAVYIGESLDDDGDEQTEQHVVAEDHEHDEVDRGPGARLLHAHVEHLVPVLFSEDLEDGDSGPEERVVVLAVHDALATHRVQVPELAAEQVHAERAEDEDEEEEDAAEGGDAVEGLDHDEDLALEGLDEAEDLEDPEEAEGAEDRDARVGRGGDDLEEADEDDEAVEEVEGVFDVAVAAVGEDLEEHLEGEDGGEEPVGVLDDGGEQLRLAVMLGAHED